MFTGGVIGEEFLLNDMFGNLYIYGDKPELIHRARNVLRIWSPFIRRSLSVVGEYIFFTDGRKSYIYDGDLFPIDFPSGNVASSNGKLLAVCSDNRIHLGTLKHWISIETNYRLTSCYVYSNKAFVAFLDSKGRSGLMLVTPRKRKIAHVGHSIITSILTHRGSVWITLSEGYLINLSTKERVRITHEAVDVKPYENNLIVLSRSSSRSYITLIDVDEMEAVFRMDLEGRYSTILLSDEGPIVIGEKVEWVEF